MNDYKVINIKNKNDEVVTQFLDINISTRMASRNFIIQKKAIYFSIPSPRVYLKAIDKYIKETKKDKFILNIPRRLFHVIFFL